MAWLRNLARSCERWLASIRMAMMPWVPALAGMMLLLAFSTEAAAKKSDDSIYFLTLSDIHFDPFIACHAIKEKPCPLIKQLQATPIKAWPKLFATLDKTWPEYRQDSDYALLTSALHAAKKVADAKQAQFVLILGDFLGHDFRHYYKKYSLDKSTSGYQAFVKKILQFLSNELATAFSNTDVYAVIGNNDSYRHDYSSDPQGKFFADAATIWSQLIKNKTNRNVMRREFTQGGYYAVNLSPANLRLIILNTVLFSNKAKGKHIEQAADKELAWLHQELIALKKISKKQLLPCIFR